MTQEQLDQWGQKIVRIAALPVTLKSEEELAKLKKGDKWLPVDKYLDVLPENAINPDEVGCDHDARYVLDKKQHLPPHKVTKIKDKDFNQVRDIARQIKEASEMTQMLDKYVREFRVWEIKEATAMSKLNDCMEIIISKYKIDSVDKIDYTKGEIITFLPPENAEGNTVHKEKEAKGDS